VHVRRYLRRAILRDRLPPAATDTVWRVPAYSLIDLFAGCGGMTRGFLDSGRFEVIFAVESDPDAAATYAANFTDEYLQPWPIQHVDLFPTADIIIGGPPCQGFSNLNRDGASAESRRRWKDYVRALDGSKPRMFVMANVPQMLKSAEYAMFTAEARSRGYIVEHRILNAADYGVPQRRRRAIVIGTMAGSVPWPEPTHGDPTTLLGSKEPWRTFRQAVGRLPLTPTGRGWHRARSPRPETLRRYAAVPKDGGNRFQMEDNLDREGLGHLVPPCWRKHRNGSHDVFGRLWWDKPASTIRTEFFKPEKGRYLHPTELRAITVREAARLMSFPDDFVLPEEQSMTAIARQVGNAVPPLLAQRLAEVAAAHMDLANTGSESMAA
jgi:DNA (cytosine-5)-methyltransferase 1